MKLSKIFGHNLKIYRFLRGFSQKDLAKLSKLSQSTIAQLESGRNDPSLDTVETIAKALKVAAVDLFVLKKLELK